MATSNLLNTLWPGSGGTANQSSAPAYNPQGLVNTLYPGVQQGVPINAAAQKIILNSTGSGGNSGGQGVNLTANNGQQGFSGNNVGDINRSYQAFLDSVAETNNRIRGEVSSGWDNYIGQLNDTLNTGLPGQRSAQENIANSQYDQGVNTVNSQKTKSLRDISSNISNAFQAGNNYLGSAGAGDSSAANQYSFALQKESAKQTSNLNEFVNTQLQTLGSTRDQQINQIASWFADAQNQVRQAIATGQLNKSQDLANLSKSLLDQGNAMLSQANQNYQNRYNALLGWAASNSSNLGQLQQNIAGIPQAIGTPQVDSSGNFRAPTGYGGGVSTTDRKNSLFQS